MLKLELGKKYITEHNSPIVIDRFTINQNGEYTDVWATWPSGKTYKVTRPECIKKIFSLDVGDKVAAGNNDPYYEVISIDGCCFKTKNNCQNWEWSIKQIFKIEKRLPKPGEVIIMDSQSITNYEYRVKASLPALNQVEVDAYRYKGDYAWNIYQKFRRVALDAVVLFKKDNQPGKKLVEVITIPDGYRIELKDVQPTFNYIDDPCKDSKVILFKTQKNRNGRYYEPSMLDKAYNDFMMKQAFYDIIGKPIFAGLPGTILAAPIVTHDGIKEEYLITAQQNKLGEKMKVTDFDKENLKAGKEDAIAKKKEYEREQAQLAYARLLSTLDEINSRIKNLEAQKKAVEKEMAEFD